MNIEDLKKINKIRMSLPSNESYNYHILQIGKILNKIDSDDFSLESLIVSYKDESEMLENIISLKNSNNYASQEIYNYLDNELSIEGNKNVLLSKINKGFKKVIEILMKAFRRLAVGITNLIFAVKRYIGKTNAKNYMSLFNKKMEIMNNMRSPMGMNTMNVKSFNNMIFITCKSDFFSSGIDELKNLFNKLGKEVDEKIKDTKYIKDYIISNTGKVALRLGAKAAANVLKNDIKVKDGRYKFDTKRYTDFQKKVNDFFKNKDLFTFKTVDYLIANIIKKYSSANSSVKNIIISTLLTPSSGSIGSVGKSLIYGTQKPVKNTFMVKDIINALPFDLLNNGFIDRLSNSCDELNRSIIGCYNCYEDLNIISKLDFNGKHKNKYINSILGLYRNIKSNISGFLFLAKDLFTEILYLRNVLAQACKYCIAEEVEA